MLSNGMISTSRLAAYSIGCLSIFAFGPLAWSQTYEGKQLVKAELLAGTNAVVPGKPFAVGLLLRMAHGWHTYWKFPGDAGIPTELKWKLPPEWKVGEIQWPIPLKLSEPGDIQIYGYHDEVLLMQEITPPASISDSTITLAAEANWLVFEKICIPGSASVQVALPVSTGGAPANTDFFERFRRLLPQNMPGSKAVSKNWRRTGADLFFTVTSETLAKYPVADFFPLPEVETVVGHPAVESRNGTEVTFRIPIETGNSSSINGLVVFGQRENDNDRAAWRIAGTPVVSATSSPPAGGCLTL